MAEDLSPRKLLPQQIRSFVKSIHDQLVKYSDVGRISTSLHHRGAISDSELQRIGSRTQEARVANSALYLILVTDPSEKKLRNLSAELKEDSSHGNHLELAEMIDKYLANATPPKPVPTPPATVAQSTPPLSNISEIDTWKPVIKAFEDRKELLKYPEAFTLKEKFTSIHGKLGKCLLELSDKQLKSLHRAVRTGIKGHFSKQIPVDIPLSEDDILDYIFEWSSPLDVRLISEAAEAIGETEALKEFLSDHKFNVVKFATELLGNLPKERAVLHADDNHAHLGIKVNRDPHDYMLAELFRLQFYLTETLGIDRVLFEGFAEGCTMVMFRLMKEAAVMIAPILLSHVCQLREFGVEKVIVFGYFAIDVQLGTLHVPSKTPTLSREKHKAEVKSMEGMHHMTMVELHALKTKLRAKEEELSQSQNELKRTREELLKCRGEVKQLEELVDVDLVEKVESLKRQLEEKSSREKEEEKQTILEEDVVSLIKDKFYIYQLQIDAKVAILSQVEEKMKNLSEWEGLADLKVMINLKKSLKSEEGSIEELKETYTCDAVIKAVTVNYEIVSSKFGKLLLQLKELWDYATKKEGSLSRKKKKGSLLQAVRSGNLEVLKLLLDTGHNLEEEDAYGNTALLLACLKGQLQVVQHLTEKRKANVYHKDKDDGNALHWSAFSGNLDLLKCLLPKFIEADKLHDVDVYGDSIIHYASRNEQDNLAMVSHIVEELKFSPEERNIYKEGATPLMRAAMYGKQAIISCLIDTHRVKLEEESNYGDTALLVACLEGQLQVVQHLTEERKVNVYHKNKDDVNALHWSAFSGNLDLLKFLLPKFIEAGKLHDVDVYGDSIIHYASRNKQDNPAMVSHIVEELKFSPEESSKDGNTALLLACHYGQLQVVQHLTEERKANVYHKDKYGNSALHLACLNGHLQVVQYLLPLFGRRKFDVNTHGKDCLTLARREGHNDIVKYLISEGGFE